MSLKLDEKNNVYKYDGNSYHRVSNILQIAPCYAGVDKEVLEAAAYRGTMVHKACENYAWGTLDESKLDVEYRGYLEAFKKFFREYDVKVISTEIAVRHAKLGYAGQIDFILMLKILNGRFQKVILDVKTTVMLMPTVGPQLGAYINAYNNDGRFNDKIRTGFALQLKKDGDYRLERCGGKIDYNDFLSFLNVYRFLEKHGVEQGMFSGLDLD